MQIKLPVLLNYFCLSFFLLTLMTASAQSNKPLLIGTLEPYPFGHDIDGKSPMNVLGLFVKTTAGWQAPDQPAESGKPVLFNIFFAGKKLGTVKGVPNADADTIYSRYYWFTAASRPVPRTGKKSLEFSGWPSYPMYRPLVATTGNSGMPKTKLQKIKYNPGDTALLTSYFRKRAATMQLGDLPGYASPLTDSIRNKWMINDSTFLIEADINLNIYCFIDSVPFAIESEYQWSRVESNLIASEAYMRDGRPLSKQVMFLVKGKMVTMAGRRLQLLDHGDYDNDGFDEIIFRQSLYNYDGYILITNRYNTVLTHGWPYH